MDQYVLLKKKDFSLFVTKIVQKKKLVAPVSRPNNNFAFEEVTRAEQIALKYIPTILPPKKYFLPQREKIQQFDKQARQWTPAIDGEDVVVFGIHTCDLAGIEFLDRVMNADPKDINYISRRPKVTTIGLECNDYCDHFASCRVMNTHLPSGGYDLFLTELKESFLIQIATPTGEELIKLIGICPLASDADKKELADLRKKKEAIFKPEIKPTHERLKPLLAASKESPVWNDLDSRCLACGNCTNVCPTCYCFDIRDDIDLNLNTGIRYRVWDGCQSENFAKVAGGENFRKSRGARQRHRYMRKFNYPVDKFQMYSCTGCGRCSRTCMAKINLKETLNALAEGTR